jgi:hypothetical protein
MEYLTHVVRLVELLPATLSIEVSSGWAVVLALWLICRSRE